MQEKKKILIVDDAEMIRRFLQDFLRLYGFEVHSAQNGKDALALIEKEHFDIIITDYSMPEMNGVELAMVVRSQNPTVLIIGISGECNEKDFLQAGANAFFSKPVQLSQVLSVCQSKNFAAEGS